MRAYFFAIFLFAGLLVCQNSRAQSDEKPYVLVLSVDGFRWDYPEHYKTPNLEFIAKQGVKAEALIPSFPSKTFPNHYTLATGLYPDHHGIVQNNFYAPKLDLHYRIGNREMVVNPDFYGGEPIWVTAEKQGITAATYFWVGSEAPVKGKYATYWKRYNHGFPFAQRIDSVVSWLKKPESERPQLIMWYMHEPDAIGHSQGPLSDKTGRTVERVDSLLGVYLDKLKQTPVYEQLNIIVLSDHGMGAISNKRAIVLDNYISGDWVEAMHGGNPAYLIDPKPNYTDSIYLHLKDVPHLSVWKQNEVPERLHYGSHARISDLVIVADSSYSVGWKSDLPFDGGAHGYDNANKDMHAIFYAMGPDFKQNYTSPAFENVQIYALLAHLLGLKPAPTDGSIDATRQMLR